MSQGDRQGALAKEGEGVKLPRQQQGQQPRKQGVPSATPPRGRTTVIHNSTISSSTEHRPSKGAVRSTVASPPEGLAVRPPPTGADGGGH